MGDVLARMKAERVFSVTREGDGFLFEECCDGEFSVVLNDHEVRQLAAELIAMLPKEK